MKKSRLIIAAAALLGVSVAATTTSTIAWFTSINKATVTIGNVVAVNASANLIADVTANVSHGTSATITNSGTSASSFSIGKLRDCSLDLASTEADGAIASIAYYDADGVKAGYTHLTDKSGVTATDGSYATKDGEDNVYYYAEFDIALKLSSTSDTSKYNVFFDPTISSITGGDGDDTGSDPDTQIHSAIRVGFRNKVGLTTTSTSGSEFTKGTEKAALVNSFVWAGSYNMGQSVGTHTYNTSTGLKYVDYDDTTTTPSGSYDNTKSFFPTTGAKTDTTGADVATGYGNMTRNDAPDELGYLGTITGSGSDSNAGTLTYHTYIWFEGEDLLCHNIEGSSQINTNPYSVKLSFFALAAE